MAMKWYQLWTIKQCKVTLSYYILLIEEKLGGKLNMDSLEVEKPKWTPKPFNRIVAFCSATNIWCADIFSHITEFMNYDCIGGCYDKVLPYNEETAKLIGTDEEYKED